MQISSLILVSRQLLEKSSIHFDKYCSFCNVPASQRSCFDNLEQAADIVVLNRLSATGNDLSFTSANYRREEN